MLSSWPHPEEFMDWMREAFAQPQKFIDQVRKWRSFTIKFLLWFTNSCRIVACSALLKLKNTTSLDITSTGNQLMVSAAGMWSLELFFYMAL